MSHYIEQVDVHLPTKADAHIGVVFCRHPQRNDGDFHSYQPTPTNFHRLMKCLTGRYCQARASDQGAYIRFGAYLQASHAGH